jgi:predicted Fe-Mo cluster-binding NifX family protein
MEKQMKIAVCAEEGHEDAQLSRCVSRSPYFIVADTAAGTFEAVRNPAADVRRHYGEAAADALIDASASAVVGTHFGHTAYRLLTNAGIAVHQAPGGVVKELVEECRSGRLPRRGEGHPCDHPATDRNCGR